MRAKIVPYYDLANPTPELYCEPFGGSGAMFYAIKKNWKEVYNDSNGLLVNMFRCLRDPRRRAVVKEFCEITPMSREIFREMKELCKEALTTGDVNRNRYNMSAYSSADAVACAFFYVQNCGFGGDMMGTYGGGKVRGERSHSPTYACEVLARRVKNLDLYGGRFANIEIENLDFAECFVKYDSPFTLTYCDPPYAVDCSKKYKQAAFAAERENELVELAIGAKGSVVISCYDNERYKRLLGAGFKRATFESSMSVCRTKREKRVETLYYRIHGESAAKQKTLFGD